MRSIKLASTIFLITTLFCSCGASADRQQEANKNDQTPKNNPAAQDASEPKAQNQNKPPRAAVDPKKFAIIVSGVGGEESYTKKFTAHATTLYEALTNRLGFDEKQVFLLMETASGGPENAARELPGRATAAEVRSAFNTVKTAAAADSTVFVVLIGHGSFDTQQAKFNLIGPDLTAKDYAQLLAGLPTRRVVFINCASSSGEFVKPLSAENRIVITATRSGNEQNATIFAEYLIAALMDSAADGDKNGRLSLMEAFNYASRLTADWYKQKNRLATEHALIDDNGDGVGHEEATAGDGALAKTLYLDSKSVEQAGADAELAGLLAERQRLEEAVEKLKARKSEMKPEEYDSALETLLVELATVNQKIKARQK
jgi:hypothetical protein